MQCKELQNFTMQTDSLPD